MTSDGSDVLPRLRASPCHLGRHRHRKSLLICHVGQRHSQAGARGGGVASQVQVDRKSSYRKCRGMNENTAACSASLINKRTRLFPGFNFYFMVSFLNERLRGSVQTWARGC